MTKLGWKLERILSDGGRADVIDTHNKWSSEFFNTPLPPSEAALQKKRLEERDAFSFVFIEALELAGLMPFTYSGRSMYGDNCPAIVYDDCPLGLGALILDATEEEHKNAVLVALQRTKEDNIGRVDMVYYWPQIKWVGEEQERDMTKSDRGFE